MKGLDTPGKPSTGDWLERGEAAKWEDIPVPVLNAFRAEMIKPENLHLDMNSLASAGSAIMTFRKQELGPDVTDFIMEYELRNAYTPSRIKKAWILSVEMRGGAVGQVHIRDIEHGPLRSEK